MTSFRFDSPSSRNWREVNKNKPCPICRKPDWCCVAVDGSVAICRREPSGAIQVKADKHGADFYVHQLHNSFERVPHASVWQPKTRPVPAPVLAVGRAEATTLNAVYGTLLGAMTLSPEHRDRLQARGLPDEAIDENIYKSFGKGDRVRLAQTVYAAHGDAIYGVPGFFRENDGPRFSGWPGIFVPCRDCEGRIVAIKIRRDQGKPRYVYLSSSKVGGPGSGAPVHVPLSNADAVAVLRVTEGELKADIATRLTGILTISVPGVSNWRPCLELIESMRPSAARLSFDSDATAKKEVATALTNFYFALCDRGLSVEIEHWDPAAGKGIDDLLAGGGQPSTFVGEECLAYIDRIASLTGLQSPRLITDNLISELVVALQEGPSGLFKNIDLLKNIAQVEVECPVRGAEIHQLLVERKVRMRDFKLAIRPFVQAVKAETQKLSPTLQQADSYFVAADGCTYRTRQTQEGPVHNQLANFGCQIVEQTVHDDGAEQQTTFAIEGSLGDGTLLQRVQVSADEFPRMNWPVGLWGTRAVVAAGQSSRDHLRAAIQTLSTEVQVRPVFGHTGWRKIGEHWSYLHAGGALSHTGVDEQVQVELPPAIAEYRLPNPPLVGELQSSIKSSLRLGRLAPSTIGFSVLAAVYRSALGPCDFGLHLAGASGTFKTELSALAQQHFGAGISSRQLPGSWSSTGNALEVLAFAAKDALLVVDDFAPNGTVGDIQRFHRDADRLLRAQGNRSGRQRLRADGSLRPAKYPRGLIFSTGEDIPRGQSLRARLLVLELSKGDIRSSALTHCQRDARDGLYSQAMSGYVAWLAADYSNLQLRRAAEVEALRLMAIDRDQHARTPGIVADLGLGLQYFLRFAEASGAVSSQEAADLWDEAWHNLLEAGSLQAKCQLSAEPAAHFLRLLTSALASGRAHIAARSGTAPAETPEAWGWREAENSGWIPQGRRLGWIEGEDLYLEAESALAEVQRLAGEQGESLAVSGTTLRKRLDEKGCLKSTDGNRGMLTVRRQIEGARREVLHIHAGVLSGDFPTNPTGDTTANVKVAKTTECDCSHSDGFYPSKSAKPSTAVGLVGLNTPEDCPLEERNSTTVSNDWEVGAI